jgi:hypothetical protein
MDMYDYTYSVINIVGSHRSDERYLMYLNIQDIAKYSGSKFDSSRLSLSLCLSRTTNRSHILFCALYEVKKKTYMKTMSAHPSFCDMAPATKLILFT